MWQRAEPAGTQQARNTAVDTVIYRWHLGKHFGENTLKAATRDVFIITLSLGCPVIYWYEAVHLYPFRRLSASECCAPVREGSSRAALLHAVALGFHNTPYSLMRHHHPRRTLHRARACLPCLVTVYV